MITKLFTPMKVGNCTIPNRLVVPAMVTNYCDEDGFLTDRYMAYIYLLKSHLHHKNL